MIIKHMNELKLKTQYLQHYHSAETNPDDRLNILAFVQ